MLEFIKELFEAEKVYRQALKNCEENAPALFKNIREKYKLSQRRLASELGCDFSYISKIENGHLRPGKPTLKKLAELVERYK